jgi:hypothetical protein
MAARQARRDSAGTPAAFAAQPGSSRPPDRVEEMQAVRRHVELEQVSRRGSFQKHRSIYENNPINA